MADFHQRRSNRAENIEALTAELGLTVSEYISRYVNFDVLEAEHSRHIFHDPREVVKLSVNLAGHQLNQVSDVATFYGKTMTEAIRVALALLHFHHVLERKGLSLVTIDQDGKPVERFKILPLDQIFNFDRLQNRGDDADTPQYRQVKLDLPASSQFPF